MTVTKIAAPFITVGVVIDFDKMKGVLPMYNGVEPTMIKGADDRLYRNPDATPSGRHVVTAIDVRFARTTGNTHRGGRMYVLTLSNGHTIDARPSQKFTMADG